MQKFVHGPLIAYDIKFKFWIIYYKWETLELFDLIVHHTLEFWLI